MVFRRDRVAIAKQRLQAVELFQTSLSNSEIAQRLGIHRNTVGVWRKKWEQCGTPGLMRMEPTEPLSHPHPSSRDRLGATEPGQTLPLWQCSACGHPDLVESSGMGECPTCMRPVPVVPMPLTPSVGHNARISVSSGKPPLLPASSRNLLVPRPAPGPVSATSVAKAAMRDPAPPTPVVPPKLKDVLKGCLLLLLALWLQSEMWNWIILLFKKVLQWYNHL